MKNKHLNSILLLVVITLFTACDTGVAFYSEWEGDYSIKSIQTFYFDSVCVEKLIEEGIIRDIYPDGHIYEQERSFEGYPPLSIFNENCLYVQTAGIGDPFIPGVDPENHILLPAPKRNSTSNDSIDNSESTSKYSIGCYEGMIYTIYNGLKISPKPINVIRASSNSLVLKNGEIFDIKLTDGAGNEIGEVVHFYWTYSPIKKEQDIYTWDAELHVNSGNIYCRHHLTFSKN